MARTSYTAALRSYGLYFVIGLAIVVIGVSLYYLSRRSASLGPNDYSTPVAHAFALIHASNGVKGAVTDTSGTTVTSFEFQPADRLQLTTSVGSTTTVAIYDGGTFYSRSGSGKWRRAANPLVTKSSGLTPIEPLATLGELSAKEKNKSVFSQESTSKCPAENRNCKVYKEIVTDKQNRIYFIDSANGKLFRIDEYLGDVLALTTRYEYTPVTIALPADGEIDTSPVVATSSAQPSVPPEVLRQFEESQKTQQVAPPASSSSH